MKIKYSKLLLTAAACVTLLCSFTAHASPERCLLDRINENDLFMNVNNITFEHNLAGGYAFEIHHGGFFGKVKPQSTTWDNMNSIGKKVMGWTGYCHCTHWAHRESEGSPYYNKIDGVCSVY